MRPIKFRAYHKEDYKMLPMSEVELNKLNYLIRAKHLVLMQFTGLTDKNGKEIYEGDIIECAQAQGLGRFKGVVHYGIKDEEEWPDPRTYLDTRPFDENMGSEFCIFHKKPEVIGNIYENSDLLA